ncbi:MAG: oligosaccharide flippase family protein [Deltaproteobacteria bacterium]|nr:oligosaccharide flippase family protein [Deltaproteobacteria bacterium]MCB9788877.1 oligosaccharide flippase family protein [Deltaproteobacteria bacterium]
MKDVSAGVSTARLSRDTLVYGIGFIVARMAGFLMLPIYTRYLTPENYATLQLLMMSLDVASILLAGGVTAGVNRFYFKRDTEREARSVIVAAWLLMTAFHLLGMAALILGSPMLAERVLHDPTAAWLVVLISFSYALDPCITVPMLLMQIQQRSGLYTIYSVVRLVLQLGLNVLFVVVLGRGVEGILWSTLITYVALALPLTVWMLVRTRLPLVGAAFRDLIRFGWPYKLTNAGAFVLTYVDRYFLLASHTLFDTGVYSLAYQFGFVVVYLSAAPFMLAWNPQRFRLAREPVEERDRAYNNGFLMFSVLMVSICVGVSLFVTPTLSIIAKAEYHEAALMAPILVAAYALQGWMQVFEFQIQVSERTHWATVGTFISVGAIVLLYALLIPPFGGYGAAIATLVAFGVRTVTFYIFGQRLWPIAWRLAPHVRLTGFAIAVVGIYYAVRPSAVTTQLVLATALSLLFFALVWWGGVLSAGDRGRLTAAIRRRVRPGAGPPAREEA